MQNLNPLNPHRRQRWLKTLPQSHPDPRLQLPWKLTQLALVLLPFSAFLGMASSLIAVILVWGRQSKKFAAQPINWGFAVLAGLMVISAIAADSPLDGFIGLANFLPFFLGFAALSELLQTTAQLRRLSWLLVLPSIPVCLIGLVQLAIGWLGYRYILNLQLLEIVFRWSIDSLGTPPGRMSSTFFYANVLASYLLMTFVLAVGLWVESLRMKPNWSQPFLAIAVGLNAIALILTHSRNAWAIAAVACLAFAFYLGWRWLAAGVSLLVSIILGAAFAPPLIRDNLRLLVPAFFWARLTDQLYPDRPFSTLRTTQWQFALSLTQQRPWLGWGLRNFRPLYQAQTTFVLGHPHSLPLMLLCETGIPATVLFLGLVGWIVAHGVLSLRFVAARGDRLLHFSVITAFLSNTLFHLFDVPLFDTRINLMGWLLLAGIWGTTSPFHPIPVKMWESQRQP